MHSDVLTQNAIKIVFNIYSTITDHNSLKKLGVTDTNSHKLRKFQFERYSTQSKFYLENFPPTEGILRIMVTSLLSLFIKTMLLCNIYVE